MRKYKVDDELMLVYVSRKQYSQYKEAMRQSNELIKYPFPFTNVRRDYFNDENMLVCEFNTVYPKGLYDEFYFEQLDWFVELCEMKPENEKEGT